MIYEETYFCQLYAHTYMHLAYLTYKTQRTLSGPTIIITYIPHITHIQPVKFGQRCVTHWKFDGERQFCSYQSVI
jgi:hypothetical protein